MIRFQNNWYYDLMIIFRALLPGGAAYVWCGYDVLAGIGAVFLSGPVSFRSALQRYATGLVNSIAHMYGTRRYSPEESGADNIWVSIITLGEGQQNRHHKNSQEWHNGIWYDPTGWFIWTLSKFGLAWDLK